MICAVTMKQARALNMGGRKGIGQKRQTQPDLGPAGLAKETLLDTACPHGGQRSLLTQESVCVI
jgi:hypothetical protein